MGITNYGDQKIIWDFKAPGKASEFNKLNFNILPVGIYEGANLTRIDSVTVQISQFTCFIEDSINSVGVKINTVAVVNTTVSPTNPYLIIRYTYSNVENNYADVIAVDYASINNNDIIIGRCAYDSGNNLQSTFDYTRRSVSSLQNLDDHKDSLKVLATESPSNKVQVNAGEVLILNNPFTFVGGLSPVISDTVNGRIDIVYIDDSGDLQILEGTDNASPVEPDFPSRGLSIAKITRVGTFTVVRGDQITQLDFDGMSGGGSSGGSGGGSSIEATTGESIDAGELVYFASDGKLYLADNREFEKSVVAGFALETAGPDSLITVGKLGLIQEFAGLTMGVEQYLGHDGLMTTSGAIVYSEYKVHVGTATADDTVDAFVQIPEPNRNYDDGIKIGGIIEWGGNEDLSDIPDGYLPCDGSAISRANYSELNSLMSAASYPWGSGDGSTTFNLPKGSSVGAWTVIGSTLPGGTTFIVNHDLGVPFNEYTKEVYFRDPTVPDTIYAGIRNVFSSGNYGQTFNGIDGDLNNCYFQVGSEHMEYVLDNGNGSVIPTDWEYQFRFTQKAMSPRSIIKVEHITTAGEPISALYDEQDWVEFTGDWQNKEFIITPSGSFGYTPEDLYSYQIDIWLADDDIPTNPVLVKFMDRVVDGYTYTKAITIMPNNDDSFKLQTGDGGVYYISPTGTAVALESSSTGAYKVVLTKINKVATYADTSFRKVYEITDATNYTFTLPDASTQITEYNIKRTGSGAGTVTVAATGSDTIEGSTSDYIMRGDETLRIIPNGTNWAIVSTNEKRVCKAWANFDGTGTPTIRDGFNVSSITDSAVGEWVLNLTRPMLDTNFAVAVSSNESGSASVVVANALILSTSEIKITVTRMTSSAGARLDIGFISVMVFGS